jgi:hypothetical protein
MPARLQAGDFLFRREPSLRGTRCEAAAFSM